MSGRDMGSSDRDALHDHDDDGHITRRAGTGLRHLPFGEMRAARCQTTDQGLCANCRGHHLVTEHGTASQALS
jgi:hypothetical protein